MKVVEQHAVGGFLDPAFTGEFGSGWRERDVRGYLHKYGTYIEKEAQDQFCSSTWHYKYLQKSYILYPLFFQKTVTATAFDCEVI
jgi:hypothetical protein